MYMEAALVCLFLVIVAYWHNKDTSDKLDFRFKQYGDSTKPIVVVIPGLDGATAFFADVIPDLTPHFNVVVYNLPLKRDNMKKEDYTFEYIAADLNSVISGLISSDSKISSIIGESFGGIVAQHFALMYPQKCETLVVLSSLAKTELPPEIEFKHNYLLPIVKGFGSYFPKFAQFLFAVIHVDDVIEPSEPRYVRDLFVKEAMYAHFHSVMARIDIAYRLDISSKVPGINVPTLIVYGSEDHFTKKDSFTLHKLIPNSEMASLPGGHLPHVTSPKLFAEMVTNFVNKRTTP